jgi:hypothetical protein
VLDFTKTADPSFEQMNLLIHLKMTREMRQRVCAVARLKVDGKGNLTIIPATGAPPETIAMADVESIQMQWVSGSRIAA